MDSWKTGPSLHDVPAVAMRRTNERLLSSHSYQRHVASGPGALGTLPRTQPRESAPALVGEQLSTPVHHAPSSQAAFDATCEAAPAVHASIVHAMPSSGTSVSSFVARQPAIGSHVSRVHGFPSLQTRGASPVHTPDAHVPPTMQRDVEHAAPFARGVNVHEPPTYASSVHGLSSLHMGT